MVWPVESRLYAFLNDLWMMDSCMYVIMVITRKEGWFPCYYSNHAVCAIKTEKKQTAVDIFLSLWSKRGWVSWWLALNVPGSGPNGDFCVHVHLMLVWVFFGRERLSGHCNWMWCRGLGGRRWPADVLSKIMTLLSKKKQQKTKKPCTSQNNVFRPAALTSIVM